MDKKQCYALEIKEGLKLNDNQFRNIYRQLESWYKDGLIEKESVKEPGQNEPRFLYKSTKKLEQFIKDLKNL